MEKCRHLENCRRLSIVFILMPCLVSPFQTQGSPSLDCKCPFLPSSRFTTVHDQLPVLSIGVCCRVSARHSAGLHAATWFARFACWFLPCDLRTQHSLSDTQQEAFISRPCAPGPRREGDSEADGGGARTEAGVRGDQPGPPARLTACSCHACYRRWLKGSHAQANPQFRGGRSAPRPCSCGVHAGVSWGSVGVRGGDQRSNPRRQWVGGTFSLFRVVLAYVCPAVFELVSYCGALDSLLLLFLYATPGWPPWLVILPSRG